MAKRRSSADITAELTVLQEELIQLSETEGTDEEVQRALDLSNDKLAQFDDLKAALGEAQEYEQKVDAVRALALSPGRTESGDGAARYLGGSGPAFNKKVDVFEGDLLRMPKDEVVSRARRLIETEKRVHVSDASRERLDEWVQRSPDPNDPFDEADPDAGFDGGYIARRMLLTEQPVYRSAFRKYVAGRDSLGMSADEQRAIAEFQRFEHFEARRALSENTTTAGGFGIPVTMAA